MNGYRMTLRQRMIGILALNALALALILVTFSLAPKATSSGQNFIRGFQVGIFVTFQGDLIHRMVKYYGAIKDNQKLEVLKIAENDERAKFIRDKIGSGGFNLSVAVMAMATVAAGFANRIVFFTLLATLVFMVMVKAALKIYYNIKY